METFALWQIISIDPRSLRARVAQPFLKPLLQGNWSHGIDWWITAE